MTVIIFVLINILLFYCFYLLYRNEKVYDFKVYLNHRGYYAIHRYLQLDDWNTDEFERLRSIWNSINEISYNRMVCSFKPLKEERWLNKEQLEFLNYGSNRQDLCQ